MSAHTPTAAEKQQYYDVAKGPKAVLSDDLRPTRLGTTRACLFALNVSPSRLKTENKRLKHKLIAFDN